MEAVRRGETFVTYGPLLEFAVTASRRAAGSSCRPAGGTVDVTWQVASVTVPDEPGRTGRQRRDS